MKLDEVTKKWNEKWQNYFKGLRLDWVTSMNEKVISFFSEAVIVGVKEDDVIWHWKKKDYAMRLMYPIFWFDGKGVTEFFKLKDIKLLIKLRDALAAFDFKQAILEINEAQNKKEEHFAVFKVMELSTAHIKESTSHWIDSGKASSEGLVIYPKMEYGWTILVPEEIMLEDPQINNIPEDLLGVFSYAMYHGCRWLMLDCDADQVTELPKYEW